MKHTERARRNRFRIGIIAVCTLLLATLSGCVSQAKLAEMTAQLESTEISAEETNGTALSRTEMNALLASTEESDADHAIAAGEDAMLEGYIPVSGKSMKLRIRANAFENASDFSQYLIRTLQYGQMTETPCSAVLLELEVYDYPNSQLPYLEDMMEIELLSADGEVLGSMDKGMYIYDGLEPLIAVQNRTIVPGWLIVETGETEPSCLRVVMYDRAGQRQTAYMALPASSGNAAPTTDFVPTQTTVGDTLTVGEATVRVTNAKTADKVFTAAVGNEYYSMEDGAQLIDLLLEYEGPVMNVAMRMFGAAVQGGVATQCDAVLLEMPDRQTFSRTYDTAEGTNLVHIVFLAPKAGEPVELLFSVDGAPYALDYVQREDAKDARPIAQRETDTVEDGFEIVIDKVAYCKEIRSTIANSKYMLHEAAAENVLLAVTYQLKNLSQEDIVLSRDAGVYITYDENAETGAEAAFYAGQVTRRAEAGKLDPAMAIAPGEQSKVNFAFVEVPKEYKNRAGTIWLSVCDVLYSIQAPTK